MTTNEPLAPIFLDNKPITSKDPKPRIAALLSAEGRSATTGVKWLTSQSDPNGRTMRPEDTLDRTSEPTKAIYLSSKATVGQGAAGKGGATGGAAATGDAVAAEGDATDDADETGADDTSAATDEPDTQADEGSDDPGGRPAAGHKGA